MRYKQTSKQVNKQKNNQFQYTQPVLEPRHSNELVSFYTFFGEVLPLLRNLNFLRYIKWEKALSKMRKGEKTTFQGAEREQITYDFPTSKSWFQNRSLIFVSGTRSVLFESFKCILIFGIENDAPPPFWNFSENSSVSVAPPVSRWSDRRSLITAIIDHGWCVSMLLQTVDTRSTFVLPLRGNVWFGSGFVLVNFIQPSVNRT